MSAVIFFWQPMAGVLWTTEGTLYWLLTLGYIVTIIATFYTTRYIDMGEFLGIRTHLRALREQASEVARVLRGGTVLRTVATQCICCA